MNDEKPDVAAIVDAMARLLGFNLPPNSRAAVIVNLDIAFRMAPAIMDFPLDDEAEPAPVFTP